MMTPRFTVRNACILIVTVLICLAAYGVWMAAHAMGSPR